MIDITRMKPGEKGKVVFIEAGQNLSGRLLSMGISVGTVIQKISAQMLKGPVTIKTGSTQIAIGFGMARKIMIEICEGNISGRPGQGEKG